MSQPDEKTPLTTPAADLVGSGAPAPDAAATPAAAAPTPAPAAAISEARLTRWPQARRLWSALQAAFSPPDNPAVMPGMDAFERSVEHVMSQQSTRRAQQLVRMVGLSVAILTLWAAFAKVDEVTRGDGRVVPSRQLQILQSLDGGVVSEIKVREGEVVEQGQLLLRIDETRATSGVREAAAQG